MLRILGHRTGFNITDSKRENKKKTLKPRLFLHIVNRLMFNLKFTSTRSKESES
jgi:hypothetical protein